jgi:HAD superfamily hydrolase (TIGR01549 family)
MTERYLNGVRCVAFDYCGTLAELRPSSEEILAQWCSLHGAGDMSFEALQFALRQAGAELPYSSLTIRTEHDRRLHFTQFNAKVLAYLGLKSETGESLYEYFHQQQRHWTLRQGVDALLRELAQRGYLIVLASNFDTTLTELLTRDGTADRFDAIFVSAALGLEKPSLEFYRTVCEQLQIQPQAVVMVGDDLTLDVRPALAVGMKAVHLTEGFSNAVGQAARPSPRHVEIATLDELRDLCPPLGGAGVTA